VLRFALDLEGPGPPCGGRRGPAVTHWGVGDGMEQIYPNNTAFQGHAGAPTGCGVAPESLFGPQGVLARGTWWGRREGLFFFLQGGPGFGGRLNKTIRVVLHLRASAVGCR
jgi:hypothetical protein